METTVLIGIPKEIKAEENRVAATPAGVAELVQAGHEVRIETGAGAAIGFSDQAYAEARGSVALSAEAVYEADLIFKVKEPQASEVALLRPGQRLFCYPVKGRTGDKVQVTLRHGTRRAVDLLRHVGNLPVVQLAPRPVPDDIEGFVIY